MTRRTHIAPLRTVSLLLLLVFTAASAPPAAYSQFMDLELEVDSRLTAHTEHPLNFGTLMTNSGRSEIGLGDINMGMFSISALERQMLLVILDKPTKLAHDNPAIEETIPIELFARYGYSTQNYQNSIPLPHDVGTITVETNPDPGPWNTIYIFIYGVIDIGNVPDGMYADRLVLNVEYF